MKSKTTEKKIIHIFSLMQKLHEGEEIYPQNERLLEEFGVDERTLRRYLDEISKLYGHIIVCEKKQKYINGKKINVYRTVNPDTDISKTLRFFLEESSELSWILTLIHDNNPSLLKNLSTSEKEMIENSVIQDKDIFLFKSNPFENLQNEQAHIFSQLKIAVKNYEYKTIKYHYSEDEILENTKCLKLIFVNNNWYVAVETVQEELRLLRIAFIEHVSYAASKSNYQKHTLAKYRHYFETMQNAMSLQGVVQKIAIVRASPKVKRYFSNKMKPFFTSQKYIETLPDGSVVFSLDYTQPLEILPFIKQWLPNLEILEPKELKELYKADLIETLSHYTKN